MDKVALCKLNRAVLGDEIVVESWIPVIGKLSYGESLPVAAIGSEKHTSVVFRMLVKTVSGSLLRQLKVLFVVFEHPADLATAAYVGW